MRNRGKWFTAFLLIAVILCGMMTVAAATAGNYIVSISDDIAGTTVVNKGDTVKLKVTVSGATFNGMQASVSYDSSLFELKSAEGAAAADDKQTLTVVELYTLQNTTYADGAKIAELTFTAIAEGTGSFGVFEATVGDYEDFKNGNAVPAKVVGDSVTVETINVSYTVEKTPDAVYWGNDSVKHGETYWFGVNDGYDASFAKPTVTMGGVAVEVAGSGSVDNPWRITGVSGDLVINSPKHNITYHSEDPNILRPANTTAHYGQNCTFELPAPKTCVVATLQIGNAEPEKLTADASGKVTIPGNRIYADISIEFAYQHTFNAPDYQWSDDYTTCTASRVCSSCQQQEAETAKSTYVTNSNGTKTFIAQFQNPAFEKQVIETDFGKNIKVTFRLIGDSVHDSASEHEEYITWIPTTNCEMKYGTTGYAVFDQVLEYYELNYRTNSSGGYVSAVKAPDVLGGYWLSEFDNGPNSGWMYTVNQEHPGVALEDYIPEDGDIIVFHYVDDWSKEEDDFTWLEADDISPETYVKRNLDKIVIIEGKGEVKPELTISDIGKNVTFSFTPAEGWHIKGVYVDGQNKGAIDNYTYKKLAMNARIRVVFEQNVAFQMSFVDISENQWFYDDVYFAVSNGLFNGTAEYTFSPNASMTRAMLVTVLYRLEGQPAVYGGSAFTDVAIGQWYTDAIIWATQNGIVNGYGNGLFGTNDSVTREQMAAILYRYAVYKGYDVSGANKLTHYSDYSELSLYALDAMKWANAEGLINGRTTTTLAPKNNATRAEVAAIIHRFVENVVK